jgi:3-dehydroquinate synthase
MVSPTITYQFSTASVNYFLPEQLENLTALAAGKRLVLLTDENLFAAHAARLSAFDCIVVPAGEPYKNEQTVAQIIQQLIVREADRQTVLVGLGGGVITDMAGYVAGVYMRGIGCGLVPSSILAMVDAAIGGKNGVDVGLYKNMVGLIRQPLFLCYDLSLLSTLPQSEWVNGFAEIIKHACIKDAAMFAELQQRDLAFYQQNPAALQSLIERNMRLKNEVVVADEFEQGDRKLLNFGHTLGHAIENEYQLPHGHAISIGMVAAAKISENLLGFAATKAVEQVLAQYGLPTHFNYDKTKMMQLLKMDKKRSGNTIHYVLLNQIGQASYQSIHIDQLEKLL